MLEDLIPIISSIIEAVDDDRYQNIEDTVDQVIRQLSSLEQIYANYDNLGIVKQIQKAITEHFSTGDYNELLVDNFKALRGLDPVRSTIINSINSEINSISKEDLLCLRQAKKKKTKTSTNQFASYSFNFDDLPEIGVLSESLDLLQSQSVQNILEGLDKLFKFDPADLIEHPQWSDLIDTLSKITLEKDKLDESGQFLVVSVCVRLLQAFEGLQQLEDVLKVALTNCIVYTTFHPSLDEVIISPNVIQDIERILQNPLQSSVIRLIKLIMKQCSTICSTTQNKTFDEIVELIMLILSRNFNKQVPILLLLAYSKGGFTEFISFATSIHPLAFRFLITSKTQLDKLANHLIGNWLRLPWAEEGKFKYFKSLLVLLEFSMLVSQNLGKGNKDKTLSLGEGVTEFPARFVTNFLETDDFKVLNEVKMIPLSGINGIVHTISSAPFRNNLVIGESSVEIGTSKTIAGASSIVDFYHNATSFVIDHLDSYDMPLLAEDLLRYQRQLVERLDDGVAIDLVTSVLLKVRDTTGYFSDLFIRSINQLLSISLLRDSKDYKSTSLYRKRELLVDIFIAFHHKLETDSAREISSIASADIYLKLLALIASFSDGELECLSSIIPLWERSLSSESFREKLFSQKDSNQSSLLLVIRALSPLCAHPVLKVSTTLLTTEVIIPMIHGAVNDQSSSGSALLDELVPGVVNILAMHSSETLRHAIVLMVDSLFAKLSQHVKVLENFNEHAFDSMFLDGLGAVRALVSCLICSGVLRWSVERNEFIYQISPSFSVPVHEDALLEYFEPTVSLLSYVLSHSLELLLYETTSKADTLPHHCLPCPLTRSFVTKVFDRESTLFSTAWQSVGRFVQSDQTWSLSSFQDWSCAVLSCLERPLNAQSNAVAMIEVNSNIKYLYPPWIKLLEAKKIWAEESVLSPSDAGVARYNSESFDWFAVCLAPFITTQDQMVKVHEFYSASLLSEGSDYYVMVTSVEEFLRYYKEGVYLNRLSLLKAPISLLVKVLLDQWFLPFIETELATLFAALTLLDTRGKQWIYIFISSIVIAFMDQHSILIHMNGLEGVLFAFNNFSASSSVVLRIIHELLTL